LLALPTAGAEDTRPPSRRNQADLTERVSWRLSGWVFVIAAVTGERRGRVAVAGCALHLSPSHPLLEALPLTQSEGTSGAGRDDARNSVETRRRAGGEGAFEADSPGPSGRVADWSMRPGPLVGVPAVSALVVPAPLVPAAPAAPVAASAAPAVPDGTADGPIGVGGPRVADGAAGAAAAGLSRARLLLNIEHQPGPQPRDELVAAAGGALPGRFPSHRSVTERDVLDAEWSALFPLPSDVHDGSLGYIAASLFIYAALVYRQNVSGGSAGEVDAKRSDGGWPQSWTLANLRSSTGGKIAWINATQLTYFLVCVGGVVLCLVAGVSERMTADRAHAASRVRFLAAILRGRGFLLLWFAVMMASVNTIVVGATWTFPEDPRAGWGPGFLARRETA